MIVAGSVADLPVRLIAASLIGLVVGLEREWSGHATGPHARFAGLRTFFLIGLAGGIAGTLILWTYEIAGVAIVVTVAALSVSAYVLAVQRKPADLDGTTEVAAIVVLGLGVLAALGEPLIAAGAGAVVVLMLGEKARLHWLVRHIAPEELEGALQFAVLALVVLPLLPTGPFGGVLNIRPRVIWAIVLLFSALNFGGYVTRRVLGANRGYGITGLLGGIVSSTAVTLYFSRRSRVDPTLSTALTAGVIGACTVLLPRVVIVSAFINPNVALALVPRLLLPAAIGVGLFLFMLRRDRVGADAAPSTSRDSRSPLALATSIRMAVAFQIAVSVFAIARMRWGIPGLYAGATLLGLTDVDALTVSVAQSRIVATTAAQAIVIGIVANTVLKFAISVMFGHRTFKRRTGGALVALAIGTVASLGLWWGW